ncbi:MAG TPA: hypothetical protein PLB59_11160 [Bacteroidales bacterium]|nr:hypothetical protein [Bacteroidales bacterium]HPB24662.1 hypothetical protein [Bacteroidales bacterium]HQN15082.1 hypothetical protein [Bacteroidales bacterium]HQP16514.1 hypothetical protein [Bacteroidales bacterium]
MEEITQPTPLQKEQMPIAAEALKYSIWGNVLSLLFFIPILGIVSCIPALILSIMGLNKGKYGMQLYRATKPKYDGGSFARTLVAFILGIVGIVQAAIMSMYAIMFTAMIFSGEFRF